MDIYLDDSADYEVIADAFRRCEAEDAVCCRSEALFTLAKQVMVKERLAGATLQLIDSDGYAIRQVTSRRREEQGAASSDQLNDRQLAVIKALEKVLGYCKKEGIQLIGYSDELVALPVGLKSNEISTAAALDIETHGVYRGAESLAGNE
ncbi:response regulator [Marinobacterium arenosum]|uniref:response regulator n=1 Tax=Marinobacterium arenosum TaxID=2862496 RepID=UPI001C96DDF4|nr:response regulator [Marinobacterium arenosum]MBY4677217.1 response regulator [Marinobacterium arenosum]